MRKFLILGLLAATASVPTAAVAQDDVSADVEISREERREARQQRREARREARQQQQQPAFEVQTMQHRARDHRREQRRAERQRGQIPEGAWIGDPNDPRMEAHRRRYERLDREAAREHGTREQYRDLVDRQASHREARREQRREDRRDWRDDRRTHWRDDRRDWRDDRREARREWNRDWRRDQRYDWRRYRDYNRYVYRAPTYYAPYRGYRYNRFSIGTILDRLFWGRNYWINNPYQYRLPQAPYGYVWVRYYGDVLLVDTYSGRVVDVIHDFFW